MLERSNATFCAYSKKKYGKPKKTRIKRNVVTKLR